MIFLLPTCHLGIGVHQDYISEYNSITTLGYQVVTFDYQRLILDGEVYTNFDFKKKSQSLILRSPHLRAIDYEKLFDTFSQKGFKIINTPDEYRMCHHLPEYFEVLSDYLPKSIWTSDLSDESLINLKLGMSGEFNIQDFSESNPDIRMKSNLNEEFLDLVKKFKINRDRSFNSGIVLTENLKIKDYGGNPNKWRLFSFFGKIISIDQFFGIQWAKCPEISNFREVLKNIKSNFFSIDLVELVDGNWKILKLDDGSQSNLSSGQNELVFYMNFLDFDKMEKL